MIQYNHNRRTPVTNLENLIGFTLTFRTAILVKNKKGGDRMGGEDMTLDELKQVVIDYYVNLQRIKKAETAENSELDYQLKVAENKLSALGIPPKDYQL